MKKLISCVLCISWLTISAIAATGVSPEFKMDLSGMGPWDVRTAVATEAISYSSAWATNALTDAKAVVKVYPVKREKPKYIAIDLSGGTAATYYPIEYLDEIPGGSWSDEYKTSKLVLRHIPAGSFIMGGRNTDYPGAVNTNLHMVTLTKDFYMGVFEVTQRQWEFVMGNRPSAFSNETCYATRPVESVSYVDIRGGIKGITWPESKEVDESSFMGQLRKKIGLTGFDLPTEAQWEYACRAGTKTALSNGMNISAWTNAVELMTFTRYAFNSGWAKDTYLSLADGYKWTDWNCTDEKGTAKVGSYPENPLGLYDMHGNVSEIVIDVYSDAYEGSIDPVGPSSLLTNSRLYIGGGWRFMARQSSSSSRHHGDLTYLGRPFSCGFRLCLHGGELPEVDDSVTLVNAAGEGAANWTPTKAGTYYLTHETQTNGVKGAEVLGAWFTVDAPKLTFVPDGDLTPGVKVAIAGAGDGWTIRYEVSGSENGGVGTRRPTCESPEYTEPIQLNDSVTIRAVAFSDGGLESLEYSATFSLMSVGGAVARPRYPWNGKVDIDVTVKGSENEDYLVSLVARDLDGGTNLPLRTAWQAFGTVTNNAFLVKPGAHRFTWDAAADITNDCEFANVVVNVSAEHSAIIAAKKVLTLEVVGYAGSETLTNVPVLVRLSTSIDGFSYADFVDAKGGDLVFTDERGSVVYPHEIDEWHTEGESLVWVKLSRMANGTKFKMAYGNSQLMTHNSQLSSHEVWRDYAGVWHMNEDSGTAYDSTANGLDALPEIYASDENTRLQCFAQMIGYRDGACGRARVNAVKENEDVGQCLQTPRLDALMIGTNFVVSAWFRSSGISGYPRLLAQTYQYDDSGWEVELNNGKANLINVIGAKHCGANFEIPSVEEGWVCLTFMFCDGCFKLFANGVLVGSDASLVCDATRYELAFGSRPQQKCRFFVGQYDEIRLRGGSLSADRIKADYDMIVNRNFLRYGPVENGKGATE